RMEQYSSGLATFARASPARSTWNVSLRLAVAHGHCWSHLRAAGTIDTRPQSHECVAVGYPGSKGGRVARTCFDNGRERHEGRWFEHRLTGCPESRYHPAQVRSSSGNPGEDGSAREIAPCVQEASPSSSSVTDGFTRFRAPYRTRARET